MKIGIIGTRGIPNHYGGFEQFAEHLATGLVTRGHDVSVYNSHKHPFQGNEWKGVHIIHRNDPEHKIGTAGQFVYDLNCIVDAKKRSFDILLHLGYTSSSVWYWKWPKQQVNIVNMDGLEWKRTKYNKFTRRFLKQAEKLAVTHADVLVADSKGVQDYLLDTYKKESRCILYGATIPETFDVSPLDEYRLLPKEYCLLVARMEPENNIEMVIRAYLASGKRIPLVVVGHTGNKFGAYLTKTYHSELLKFTGAIFEQDKLNALRFYSSLYFHGHSVGGTNPSLLEAMACHCDIVANDNIFNRAVLEADADYFKNEEDIKEILRKEFDREIWSQRRSSNLQKIRNLYNWDRIIDQYESLFLSSMKHRASVIPFPLTNHRVV